MKCDHDMDQWPVRIVPCPFSVSSWLVILAGIRQQNMDEYKVRMFSKRMFRIWIKVGLTFYISSTVFALQHFFNQVTRAKNSLNQKQIPAILNERHFCWCSSRTVDIFPLEIYDSDFQIWLKVILRPKYKQRFGNSFRLSGLIQPNATAVYPTHALNLTSFYLWYTLIYKTIPIGSEQIIKSLTPVM